jgi:hypothetical protein
VDLLWVVPCQLLHTLLDCWPAEHGEGPMTLPKDLIRSRLPLFKFPCANKSWIAPLGRFLSHEWIDMTHVSSKAAKLDDEIACDMWNKRMLLVYPRCTVEALETLRSWLLTIVRRRLLQSLRSYLAREMTWCCILVKCRSFRLVFKDLGSFRDKVNAYLSQQGGKG